MSTQVRPRGDQLGSAAHDGAGTDSPKAVDVGGDFASTTRVPLPRPERRRRRAQTDRGLPPDEELKKLAKAYLDRQRKHWPKIVEAGLLPEPLDLILGQMVEDFKERHRTGKVDVAAVRPFLKFSPKLAGSYNRYSCDNSSPNSALDQMVNSLDKAQSELRFIPWQYVFADYSVTGLDAGRQGYTSYKLVLAEKVQLIETTYIDDFTRASRDELEWWKLAALSKRLNKRMIGASDGFDLNSPDWDLKLTIYGLLSRLFLKGLREKGIRGMRGAARRGTNLGKLSLGFTRWIHLDQNGHEVRDRDGLPVYEPCIDPVTREFRLLMFQLFVEQNWSVYKIMRHFNQLNVDGWKGWTQTAIARLLGSPTAIGVFIWNRKRREYDREQEKWIVTLNPPKEWEIRKDRNLAIVPMHLWRAARRKLGAMRRASPLTGRKPSRNQNSATTLFSGTLYCDDCEEELTLIRSTPKHKQMGCCNGIVGAHDCKLSSSKSLRIIENSLLNYLRDMILTEPQVEALVVKANAVLEEEAQRPLVNTAPWKAEVRKLDVAIAKLMRRVEKEPNEELCDAYDKRIKELQKDRKPLLAKIREAEPHKPKAVKPLTVEVANVGLDKFRKVLGQEIPMAASALRTLTGPITIRQEPIPGLKMRTRWIAKFSPDLARALQSVAADNFEMPISSMGDAADAPVVEVVIEKIPKYERMAAKFKELKDGGASVNTIAAAHGMSWQYAQEILDFAETGVRPNWKAGKRTGQGGKRDKHKEIAPEVVALKDKKMSFPKIAKELHVSEYLARRAFDYARPEAVRKAIANGTQPDRGRYSHLGEDKLQKIRELLGQGKETKEIIGEVGCGASTVNRVRKQMKGHDAAA